MRTILGIDEAAQTMTFAGDMRVGARARPMRANLDSLVADAEEAATQALGGIAQPGLQRGTPVLALSVSCIGRRLVMGARVEDELEAVTEQLPPGSVHAGFYSHGEVAPGHGFLRAGLHNQTIALTLLAED